MATQIIWRYRGFALYKTVNSGAVPKAGFVVEGGDVPKTLTIDEDLKASMVRWQIGTGFYSIRETSPGVPEDPSVFLGYGTWAQIGVGRVLVGVNSGDPDFSAASVTGGAKDHYHWTDIDSTTSGGPSATQSVQNGTGAAHNVGSDTHTHTVDPASKPSSTVKHLMPYECVYFWIRTA
jgi:hypothetical protein